ncbi:MAG: DUF3147 family protein [Thiotrichales bacterium]|jgi:hypothetical protein|nr:DUF3147 family protein [Thiotrichales bacterium]
MTWIVAKYLLTAGMVVLISEIAKRSDKAGGLIAALPLITIMTLVWLYLEGQTQEKIANHAWYTFWYVVPTLPMFLLFPHLLSRVGFWSALAISAVVTMVLFVLFVWLVRQFGIELL